MYRCIASKHILWYHGPHVVHMTPQFIFFSCTKRGATRLHILFPRCSSKRSGGRDDQGNACTSDKALRVK
ncbi:hypothetical protein CEXT_489051 [Caerostris extrusa]|uniref:Ycf15 n=1 Tax=Caerostris extrusa TaxID=172846 RepID=A0AAV4YA09_CAEEX|nr:hypothetical protein CEXT_489051 [Caerostris extrusa]